MKKEISIALVQLTSTDNVDYNFKIIYDLISQITENVDWVVLPENALYFRIDEQSPKVSFDLTESYFQDLQKLCERKQFPIILGAIPVKKEGHIYNSTVVVNAINSAAIYDKIHLFDVEVEGERSVRESDQFKPGKETIVISRDGWRLGMSICYDLRFAELYSQYVKDQVDIIFVPAAFLSTTGKAHWHVLLRARAIENQCYVVAPAQSGKHSGLSGKVRETYGHSLIVDPWGEVICDMGEASPNIAILKLSKDKIEKVKKQIPMIHHRKLNKESVLND